MREVYAPFLAELPPQGRILDAGCGSGRDSLAFLKMGYSVVSMDASVEMVKAAETLTGQEVPLLRFDEITFSEEFDGIWACASLLHVARQDLSPVLGRLVRALRPGGVLYMSFKLGEAERLEEGRFFNDMTEASLEQLLETQPDLQVLKIWTSDDVRDERQGAPKWLNVLVRRIPPAPRE
jgi:SAM-dependent methyltransferase